MKMVTNLWKPTRGTVELFGKTLTKTSYGALKRMGSMIEFPCFYEHMSGRENLWLHCEYMGYHTPGSAEEALDMLGLAGAGDAPVKSYSLGMWQRLGIARAILCRPELLVLDEPANELDPAGMEQIRELFQRLCGEYGMTILVSSHILSEVESIAHTIGIIHHGKMLKEISMREVSEMNAAYMELDVKDVQRAAYVLADRMGLDQFKIMDGSHSESLEDYFLKMTEGVER